MPKIENYATHLSWCDFKTPCSCGLDKIKKGVHWSDFKTIDSTLNAMRAYLVGFGCWEIVYVDPTGKLSLKDIRKFVASSQKIKNRKCITIKELSKSHTVNAFILPPTE